MLDLTRKMSKKKKKNEIVKPGIPAISLKTENPENSHPNALRPLLAMFEYR